MTAIPQDPAFQEVRRTVALMREKAKETEGKKAGCNQAGILYCTV